MVKNLENDSEARSFTNGVSETVVLGDMPINRARFEPGWRWSNDIKPIVGTDRCMMLHRGYIVSGSMVIQADDGSETTIGPGDAYQIDPGHDAWVIGDEACIGIDFAESAADYAKPQG